MKKVFEADNPPEDIYFIMQYEAFLRYSGQPFYNESLRSLLYKPWFSAELIYEFKPSDFYPVPNARICFAHFQRKTSADVEDATDYRNFLSYIFLASGNTFKDKTKKLFTYEQQKRICKFLKIKLESTLTEISYDGWLYLYDVFLKFVSNEKKAIILNAEQDMKNNQNKIQKKHRNRNHGYWKFEAKRQKKLKFENGAHRVQRIPVTESAGRVHTSTATVGVMPEAEDVDVDIDPKDIRVDVYRSSGAGGQHVNKTSSAVRMTHLPTGIVVAMQDERSQQQNRAKAMRILKSRVYDYYQQKEQSAYDAKRKDAIGTGDRSERIRTYNYPQNRVTDHRIGLTLNKLDKIMSGDLDEIIEALIVADQTKKLEQLRNE